MDVVVDFDACPGEAAVVEAWGCPVEGCGEGGAFVGDVGVDGGGPEESLGEAAVNVC